MEINNRNKNTIQAFQDYLRIERNMSLHTIDSYTYDLNQCEQFLINELHTDFETVKFKDLRYWVVYLSKQQYSATSINRKIASVKSLFKFLIQIEYIETNPTSALKSLKTPKHLPDFYSNDELETLFKNESMFEGTDEGLRDQLLIIMLFSTGIRQSELINMRWGDIDFSRKQIKILGKRQKERFVYLTEELCKLLEVYKQGVFGENSTHESLVFLTNKYNKLYPKFVYRKVNYYLSFISNGRKKSPHVLRHSFATELMNNDVEINSIKEVLGHSNLSSTEIYTHNSKDRMIKEYKSYHPRGGNKTK
ncbi:MAG: tyrosine-type recombinase/integrase [Flavobacteriales bacterium]